MGTKAKSPRKLERHFKGVANHRRIQILLLISRCPEIIQEEIIEEFEQIKRFEPDNEQKLRIIPKEQVKEILGRSPDWSDMIMMRMFFELQKPHDTTFSISEEDAAEIADMY